MSKPSLTAVLIGQFYKNLLGETFPKTLLWLFP